MSAKLRPAGDELPGPTSNSDASRNASRLPPWIVRDSWVGRPCLSLPVKTRTSHTPGRFSRSVAIWG